MAKQQGPGGVQGTKTPRPPSGRLKGAEPGSLEDARGVLWTALKRAEKALKSRDHGTALKGVHAASQCATAYARIVEVSELEARIRALEGQKREES